MKREKGHTHSLDRGKVRIFPSPRAYIKGQISESMDIFPNMTSGGKGTWGTEKKCVPKLIFDLRSGV